MSFFKLLIIIILLMCVNFILNNKIKRVEKKITDSINYSYDNKELNFKRLARKYIENLGYVFVQESMDNITIDNNNELILICCKDLNKEEKRVHKEYIMRFISHMVLKSASKGIFIYSGEISKDIKSMVEDNKNFGFNIELVNEKEILSKINKGILS